MTDPKAPPRFLLPHHKLIAFQVAVELLHAVRSAQFTVLNKGSIVLERAYTWSEPGTRRTGLRDRMLLASCSSYEARMKRPHVYQGGAYYEDAVHPGNAPR